MHFNLFVNKISLRVWKHYIQFTLFKGAILRQYFKLFSEIYVESMWIKSPETVLHVHLQLHDFSPELNGLLLAYLEGSWIIMLSSALIGCFTVLLNVELCSDWLFRSVAQCWALLWLAVSQCCLMLNSALIGCFVVRLNVELCSDWLFRSAAQCWALLWLAVSQCGSMLSSALIGCFTVWLNVELCSYWLFHSAA